MHCTHLLYLVKKQETSATIFFPGYETKSRAIQTQRKKKKKEKFQQYNIYQYDENLRNYMRAWTPNCCISLSLHIGQRAPSPSSSASTSCIAQAQYTVWIVSQKCHKISQEINMVENSKFNRQVSAIQGKDFITP